MLASTPLSRAEGARSSTACAPAADISPHASAAASIAGADTADSTHSFGGALNMGVASVLTVRGSQAGRAIPITTMQSPRYGVCHPLSRRAPTRLEQFRTLPAPVRPRALYLVHASVMSEIDRTLKSQRRVAAELVHRLSGSG